MLKHLAANAGFIMNSNGSRELVFCGFPVEADTN